MTAVVEAVVAVVVVVVVVVADTSARDSVWQVVGNKCLLGVLREAQCRSGE